MQRFNWSLTAFNFAPKGGSYKLKIEEAEDNFSMAIEMLKAVRHMDAPEEIQKPVEEVAQEMFHSLDKLRLIRTNMKMQT
jgi:hypothetical protein